MTSDTTSVSPRGDLGDRLVSAAAEVFTERGYDRATVAEIARRAGVTTGAIYSRYRGKADLLADALGDALVEQIEAFLPEAPGGGADLLHLLGTNLFEMDHSNGWLLLEGIVASRRDPELADVIRRTFEDDESRLAKLVEQGKADGAIDSSLDTAAIVHFAASLGLGVKVGQLIQRTPPGADEWNNVIDVVVGAAAPRQTSP